MGKRASKSKSKGSDQGRKIPPRPMIGFHWTQVIIPPIILAIVYALASSYKSDKEHTIPREEMFCQYVMARSAIPNAGWGIFTLLPLPKSSQVMHGGPVLQITNLEQRKHGAGILHFLGDYSWGVQNHGGLSEGMVVTSLVPGVGTLANGDQRYCNIGHTSRTDYDPADLRRGISPGAGSITLYHNKSYETLRDVPAGGELLLSYGQSWNDEHQVEALSKAPYRSVRWLSENGMCIDHLRPGISPGKGRGAFATRALSKGAMIAPLPLATITRSSLDLTTDPFIRNKYQLFLNYCFGDEHSSLLLFPYAPTVNYLNHDAQPNAKVEWTSFTDPMWFSMNVEQVIQQKKTGSLVLQLVALRDIASGEEVTIDYGQAWHNAWEQHVSSYQVPNEDHAYPNEFNDSNPTLRTTKELNARPYPPNLETACYFDSSVHHQRTSNGVTRVAWQQAPPMMDPRFLFRCSVLERRDDIYTIEIHNYETVSGKRVNILKDGERMIVDHVPRSYITFQDHLWASDQHLSNAFRHEIGLPDGVFPAAWKDL